MLIKIYYIKKYIKKTKKKLIKISFIPFCNIWHIACNDKIITKWLFP